MVAETASRIPAGNPVGSGPLRTDEMAETASFLPIGSVEAGNDPLRTDEIALTASFIPAGSTDVGNGPLRTE
jgi:hypothetical protein